MGFDSGRAIDRGRRTAVPEALRQGLPAGGPKEVQFGRDDIPHHPSAGSKVFVQEQIPQTHDLPPIGLRVGILALGWQAARGFSDDFEVPDDGVHRCLVGSEPGVVHALDVAADSINRAHDVVQVEAVISRHRLLPAR